ncbi:MAG: hypothetical protein RBT81_06295 [Gammaproteobacteria bacterium]|jgi:hypothetical protein|nr:hypothetical protein [Gammaproteobacteria bacterium]
MARVLFGIWLASLSVGAWAEIFIAGPESYRSHLKDLRPGDILRLEPGTYRKGLPLRGLQGGAGREIVIEGPAEGGEAVFIAQDGTITISLIDVAHVTIRRLRLEGRGARAHAVVAEGRARFSHDVTLEDLRISGYDAAQGYVGISTKAPAWNWVIRNNHISDAGTGMYLGNSDGRAPFVAGLIEGNVIERTLGYSLQIKHQLPRPALAGMPQSSKVTVIRDNVFSKRERGSAGERARPNVLLGHWPLQGAGRDDRYLVYRNVFLHNPHERLFQGEGHVSLCDNVFVNAWGEAISLQAHNDVPREIDVFDNVIASRSTGLRLSGADPGHRQRVSGNVMYTEKPNVVPAELQTGNVQSAFEEVAALIAGADDAQRVAAVLRARAPVRSSGGACLQAPDIMRDAESAAAGAVTGCGKHGDGSC